MESSDNAQTIPDTTNSQPTATPASDTPSATASSTTAAAATPAEAPADVKTEAPKPLWGRLVSLNDKFPNVELRDESISIGRSVTQCSVVIDSPAISGKHCTIYREKSELSTKGGALKTDTIVLIKDTSTNGTFVNGDLVGKNNTKLLFDGCDISLLPKKSSADRIAFIFQDCQKEMAEIEQGGPQAVYEMKRELGTGTFASVKLAVHRTTGEEVAIKVIDKQKFLQKAKRKDALMDEVRVLTSVSHPNILQIKGVFETPSTLYLVLELATGGELFDRVAQGAQEEATAREIFYQILLAIKYLHAQGIAHRDLKPENILLASPTMNTIKISDFGLSRIIDEGTYMKTICGTPQYVAPEILTKAEKEGYGKAVDMWSLGVILFVLLGGYAPFEDDPDKRMTLFEKIKKAKYSFNPKYWNHVSEDAKDLIRNLLVVDPAKRLTAEQSLAHPWIHQHLHILNPSSLSSSSSSTTTPSSSSTPAATAEDPDTKTPVITSKKSDTPTTSDTTTDKKNKTEDKKSKSKVETEDKSPVPTVADTTPRTPLSARRKRKAASSSQSDETLSTAASNGTHKAKKAKENDEEEGEAAPAKKEKDNEEEEVVEKKQPAKRGRKPGSGKKKVAK